MPQWWVDVTFRIMFVVSSIMNGLGLLSSAIKLGNMR